MCNVTLHLMHQVQCHTGCSHDCGLGQLLAFADGLKSALCILNARMPDMPALCKTEHASNNEQPLNMIALVPMQPCMQLPLLMLEINALCSQMIAGRLYSRLLTS